MQIIWTKINKIVKETPEVRTYFLDLPEGFSWDEGAFTHLGLKGFNEGDKPNRGLVRHMSICTLPSENKLAITTRIKELRSEFKEALDKHQIGDEVAIFKTFSNVPLKRENKNLYLLSSGVGLATFRPLVLDYLADTDGIHKVHSLNIDSSNDFLFEDIFTDKPEKNFTTQFVNNRQAYYAAVEKLANDPDGLYYIVGSDEFLTQNIAILREQGIQVKQIVLDKRQDQLEAFFSAPASI